MGDFVVVFVTCANKDEAEKISKNILQDHLAACVNIIDPVSSFFHWKGKIDHANESLLCIKTRLEFFAALRELVKKLHSYDVPEIIVLPIIEGDQAYLNWIDEETQSKK